MVLECDAQFCVSPLFPWVSETGGARGWANNKKVFMQIPKRTKYRKYQKNRCGGIQPNNTQLQFGKYGLKALQAQRISAQTVEAVRRVITRQFKRSGMLWIRIFPDTPVSSKPAAMRMGKGKGNPFFWVCRVQSGQILYEMDGVSLQLAQQAARQAAYKLPIKTTFVRADG